MDGRMIAAPILCHMSTNCVPKSLQSRRYPWFTKKRDFRTDGPTDRPSYRDAMTHLKSWLGDIVILSLVFPPLTYNTNSASSP